MKRHRLAIVASHPIQYLGIYFRLLHQHPDVDVNVFFCCDHGQQASLDRDFATTFAWETPITAGYPHEYIRSLHPRPSPYGFFSLVNPALLTPEG